MKKGTAITFAVGVFAGMALCGPAAQAANSLTATLSNQPVYVDGQRVALTAYQIGGNNYVKLRDVGEAVGFNVYWDGGAVQIESNKPYTGEGPVAQSSVPRLSHSLLLLSLSRVCRQHWPPCGSGTPTARSGPLPTAPPAAGPTTAA